jgi:hypothetical protein
MVKTYAKKPGFLFKKTGFFANVTFLMRDRLLFGDDHAPASPPPHRDWDSRQGILDARILD